MDKIMLIGRQICVGTGKLNAGATAGKGQVIAQVDGVQDGFEFVKTVGPLAEHVQQQIDLARRIFFHVRFVALKW